MASLVAHVKIQPAGTGGGTSSSIDTSTANLIVAQTIVDFALTQTFSDNKGNTWTNLSGHATGDNFAKTNLFYCLNPTVGSGHTFTIGATSGSPATSAVIAAFKTAQSFDTQTSGTGNTSSTTIQGGSITAGASPALLISAVGWRGGGGSETQSIDSGFTITDQVPNATTYACSMSYLVQNSASAINPTWTLSTTPNSQAAVNYSFAFSNEVAIAITEGADAVAATILGAASMSVAITESPDVVAATLASTFGVAIAITESPDAVFAQLGYNIVINIASEDADTIAMTLSNPGSWNDCTAISTPWTDCTDTSTTWTECPDPSTTWTVN